VVEKWTGAEAEALRLALRMSVRDFASHLGIAARTVSYWSSRGQTITPLPETQEILDAALDAAPAEAHRRFQDRIAASFAVDVASGRTAFYDGAELADWGEDLERAQAATAQQHFALADRLLSRWLSRPPPPDGRDAELYARSLLIFGDVHRDQGQVVGPGSAATFYEKARAMFAALGLARRQAQAELAAGVVMEMSGAIGRAADRYAALSKDGRLSPRDRARALLWTGTALTKQGLHVTATEQMQAAAVAFERLGEVEDWSVTFQKLGLVHRAVGELDAAHAAISTAEATGTAATPLQQVRLWTARGHILLSDRATTTEGASVLAEALAITARSRSP
jgi:transcriptional regulator with XRE-family HTH domain